MFHILSGWMQQPTPNQLLTLPSYRGFPPVHQNGGGTGMAFVENAPRVLKKEQLGGLGRHRRHRVKANAPRHKKHTTPKLSSDGKCINLNSCFFFGFFSVCTSTRMGLNRPEVQEGAWLSQHQQRRWRHIQDIWVFCMMAGWLRRRKGSAIVLWMILLQEAAKEEQDTDDLEEEDEEAQRRASCVETRAVCARVASKRV